MVLVVDVELDLLLVQGDARERELGGERCGHCDGSRLSRRSREQAEARHGQLLDAALDHFLDRGFDQATVEAIATSVNMTKRTVYALYPDKVSLFRAAVHRAIEALAVPPEELEAAVSSSLEDTLAATEDESLLGGASR